MKTITKCIYILVLIFSLLYPSANAQWSDDPAVNNAICTAGGGQYVPTIVDDGSGGAIITWYDNRSGNNNIYAQRINSSGIVLWTSDGVAICTAGGTQLNPKIVSDGSSGAIITWYDNRSGNNDIYAQQINSSGAVQWTTDGVAICTATDNQQENTIESDGSGGAIITWRDTRSGNYDIYAQRINSSGAVQWTADGVAICTATNSQYYPTIVRDESGGAIITWQDQRNGNLDIYAQRINSSGTVQWTSNGVAICTAGFNQQNPTIVSDGSGGAIITWYDARSGVTTDIYAQSINSSGAVQWTSDGLAISTAGDNQYFPTIVSDGSGGAIITWRDDRNGFASDIYTQRINSSGAVQWTSNGVAISMASGHQYNSTIVSDGSGGAIITWQDSRSGNFDIYTQRINSSGTVQWTLNGVAICTAGSDQEVPTIVSDGSGGAIITWHDSRNGATPDIYAQYVNSTGLLTGHVFLTSPVSSDSWSQGSTHNITWTSTAVTNIKIEFSLDGGSSWSTVVTSMPASANSYNWTVPSTPTTQSVVRIKDTSNSTVLATSGSFTISLSSPSLLFPSSGSQANSVLPSLSWSKMTGVTRYNLLMSTSYYFTSIVVQQQISDTTYSLTTPLNNNTLYYWKVSGVNSQGNAGDYSSPFSFVTVLSSADSILISPVNGSTGLSVTPTLTWPATIGADKYRLEVNTNIGFGVATSVFDSSNIKTTSKVINGLAINTINYWRVTASSNSLSKTNAAIVYSFTTGSVLPVELSSFTVSTSGGLVSLGWKTATEFNNYGFEVQRSGLPAVAGVSDQHSAES